MLGMPWLIRVITPGFAGTPESLDLVSDLTRICFPYLGLVSLVALFSGVLNTSGRFLATAIAPVAMNLVIILSCLYVWSADFGDAKSIVRLLAYAVVVAGIVQLTIVAVASIRIGMPVTPARPKATPEVVVLLRKCVPGLISGGISQFNLIVAMAIASGFPGAVAYLYYAEKIIDLPLAVIGAALSLVLLPTLSRAINSSNSSELTVSRLQNRAIELSFLLSLPAAAALMILAEPIIKTVFQRGAFLAQDTRHVASALIGFAIGLPALNASRLLQLSAVARGNMILPMKCAIASAVANLVGCLWLSQILGFIGIAIATSLAAWINLALLYFSSRRSMYFEFDSRSLTKLPRIAVATAAMSFCIWILAIEPLVPWLSLGASVSSEPLVLACMVVAGLATYFGFAAILGLLDWRGVLPSVPPSTKGRNSPSSP
jgi:putative peptidoglycan lipid II flippase